MKFKLFKPNYSSKSSFVFNAPKHENLENLEFWARKVWILSLKSWNFELEKLEFWAWKAWILSLKSLTFELEKLDFRAWTVWISSLKSMNFELEKPSKAMFYIIVVVPQTVHPFRTCNLAFHRRRRTDPKKLRVKMFLSQDKSISSCLTYRHIIFFGHGKKWTSDWFTDPRC